jgi:hypothetical protein
MPSAGRDRSLIAAPRSAVIESPAAARGSLLLLAPKGDRANFRAA